MQDRFKFRVFDKQINKMIKPTRHFNYCIVNGTIVGIESYSSEGAFYEKRITKEFDDAIIMQCTGLKDKNGKLIYENDIVKFYFDNEEIIAVLIWDNDESRFYLNTTDYFKDKYVTDYEITKQEKYEVIGNIYENEELLNGNNP